MRLLSIFILTSIFLFSCDDDDCSSACNCDNPVEEIAWLQELKSTITSCTCEYSIQEGEYKGETVFYIQMTDPLCDGIDTPTLFDCDGKEVHTFTLVDYKDFNKDVKYTKTLYTCTKTNS